MPRPGLAKCLVVFDDPGTLSGFKEWPKAFSEGALVGRQVMVTVLVMAAN